MLTGWDSNHYTRSPSHRRTGTTNYPANTQNMFEEIKTCKASCITIRRRSLAKISKFVKFLSKLDLL